MEGRATMRWRREVELLLLFLFGVTVELAMMYAICDLGLAEQEREELHRLFRWRWSAKPILAQRGNLTALGRRRG